MEKIISTSYSYAENFIQKHIPSKTVSYYSQSGSTYRYPTCMMQENNTTQCSQYCNDTFIVNNRTILAIGKIPNREKSINQLYLGQVGNNSNWNYEQLYQDMAFYPILVIDENGNDNTPILKRVIKEYL